MPHENFIDWIKHHRNQIVIDLVAGSISGVCNCVSSHPMDTVKVRMQCSTNSMLQVMKNTYKNEGYLAFYKGMEFPLMAVPILNAVVFTTYEFCRRIITTDDMVPMEYWKMYKFIPNYRAICGGSAGFVSAFLSSPIELAKCRLQVQKEQIYKGPFDCMKQIIKAEGLTGPYRGLVVTQLREIRGYGVQFPTYEAMKDFLCWAKGQSTPTNLDLLISGGLGGVACWTVGYPQDTVKTMLQLQTSIKPEDRLYKNHPWIRDGGYKDCYNQIKQREGWQGLWKGFSACLIRAFYANAIGFYAYEISKQYIVRMNMGVNNE